MVVFANNNLGGFITPNIANFTNTMEELLLTNTNISGCLPMEVGFLYKLRVLDVSSNKSAGILADDQNNCPPDKPLQNDDS